MRHILVSGLSMCSNALLCALCTYCFVQTDISIAALPVLLSIYVKVLLHNEIVAH